MIIYALISKVDTTVLSLPVNTRIRRNIIVMIELTTKDKINTTHMYSLNNSFKQLNRSNVIPILHIAEKTLLRFILWLEWRISSKCTTYQKVLFIGLALFFTCVYSMAFCCYQQKITVYHSFYSRCLY